MKIPNRAPRVVKKWDLCSVGFLDVVHVEETKLLGREHVTFDVISEETRAPSRRS